MFENRSHFMDVRIGHGISIVNSIHDLYRYAFGKAYLKFVNSCNFFVYQIPSRAVSTSTKKHLTPSTLSDCHGIGIFVVILNNSGNVELYIVKF